MSRQSSKPATQEPMSFDEALLFGFFIQQCYQARQHNKIDQEGYFFVSYEHHQKLPMTDSQRSIALVSLMVRGYIAMKRNMATNQKSYKVYIDSLLEDIKPGDLK